MMEEVPESAARRSFRLKVEYLEECGRQEGPIDVWIPRKIADLVAWEDPARGFTRWVSFSVASLNGVNGDLRRRYNLVIASLQRRITTGGVKRRRGREVLHAQAMQEVKSLAQQNAKLLDENIDLRAEVTRHQSYISILEKRERGLIEQLNRLLPLDKRMLTRTAG